MSKLFRKDTKEIIEEYENIGYKIIKGIEEYKNDKSKLVIKCDMGHEFESYYAVLRTGSKCPFCFGKIKPEYDFVKNEFIKRDCILLSEDYKNSAEKLKYICKIHADQEQFISWSNFNSGQGCFHCGQERTANARRLDFEIVKMAFIDKDYILLDNTYQNNSTHLRYICNKHRDHGIQHIAYSCLQQGQGCYYCSIERRSGENHPCWNGGVSPLHEYLRSNIIDWKNNSKENSKYKCVVTGEKFDVIHHLYSFNKILKETIEETKLPIHTQISEYTKEELQLLSDKCLEIHYRYPLGVCLREDVHTIFHQLYGKKDNTPEQFYEFIERYNTIEVD